jgi:hypothetical protein
VPVGELEDAIREHLELKRRRGADPSEVAKEEEEALAPVTRSHPVVVLPETEHEAAPEPESAPESPTPAQNGGVAHGHDGIPEEADGELEDATQEYLVAQDDPRDAADWLDDEDS